MRFIYTDEAGTSTNEPATVVAGIIVHADKQLLPAVSTIEAVLTLVPERYRKGFVFHATSIWNSPKYRTDWSMEERKLFLMQMMAVPRACGIAISYGLFYRDGKVAGDLGEMTLVQHQHAHAFGSCMASADEYIRKFAAPEEVATVVAEDIPEMRKNLERAMLRLRAGSVSIPNARITQEIVNEPPTRSEQTINLRIRRVIHGIHFTPKYTAHLGLPMRSPSVCGATSQVTLMGWSLPKQL